MHGAAPAGQHLGAVMPGRGRSVSVAGTDRIPARKIYLGCATARLGIMVDPDSLFCVHHAERAGSRLHDLSPISTRRWT